MRAPGLERVSPVDDLPARQAEVPEPVDVLLVELHVHGAREGGAAGAAAWHPQHVAVDVTLTEKTYCTYNVTNEPLKQEFSTYPGDLEEDRGVLYGGFSKMGRGTVETLTGLPARR